MTWTNRGSFRVMKQFGHNSALPSEYYLALVKPTPAPTVDTNTMSDLDEITAGNGYPSGGVVVNRNATDFDSITEDDSTNRGIAQLKDYIITASGGNIPPSGDGFRYIVLTDNNASVAAREVYMFWDLGSEDSLLDTQALTLQDLTMNGIPA
jgi:hypothetical protein